MASVLTRCRVRSARPGDASRGAAERVDGALRRQDASKIHNFQVEGPGGDQRTGVPDVGETTWTVNLSAGTYTHRCDPHRGQMRGSFTVT